MNFFVTKQGKDYASNLSQKDAVKTAKKLLEKDNLSGLEVGIGKIKYVKGKRVYTLLPCMFYF